MEEAEDPITFASLYNTLGGIYWSHIRYSEAIESVKHSLSIHRSLGYHWGIAAALNNLGVLYFSMNKWSEALDCLEQADKLRCDCGFDPERPINLRNIGEVLVAMGENTAARRKLVTGIEFSQRFGIDLAQRTSGVRSRPAGHVGGKYREAAEHLATPGRYIELPDEISDRNADFYILHAQILISKKKS